MIQVSLNGTHNVIFRPLHTDTLRAIYNRVIGYYLIYIRYLSFNLGFHTRNLIANLLMGYRVIDVAIRQFQSWKRIAIYRLGFGAEREKDQGSDVNTPIMNDCKGATDSGLLQKERLQMSGSPPRWLKARRLGRCSLPVSLVYARPIAFRFA